MADFNHYITAVRENGNVMISEEVIAAIVIHSATEVEAIKGLTGKHGNDVVTMKNWGRAIKVFIGDDNTLKVDCNVTVKYGSSVVDVAKNLQQVITGSLESITGVKVANVNINICGIARQ